MVLAAAEGRIVLGRQAVGWGVSGLCVLVSFEQPVGLKGAAPGLASACGFSLLFQGLGEGSVWGRPSPLASVSHRSDQAERRDVLPSGESKVSK